MVGMHFAYVGVLFFMLLLVAGFVAGIVVLATRNPARPIQAGPEAPLDVLARRFAAGEINAEEYQKARDLLKGEPSDS